jgi:hypothetical protein
VFPTLRPHAADIAASEAYLHAMAHGFSRLNRSDGLRAAKKLPDFFAAVCDALKSPKTEVAAKAAKTARTLLRDCVSPPMVAAALAAIESRAATAAAAAAGKKKKGKKAAATTTTTPTPLERIIAIVHGLFALEFRPRFREALSITSTLLSALPREAFPLCTPLLQQLDELRLGDDATVGGGGGDGSSDGGVVQSHLDAVVGTGVARFGARAVLSLLPVNLLPGDDDDATEAVDIEGDGGAETRDWLLPLLKTHVACDELAVFADVLLPMAPKLLLRSELAYARGDVITGRQMRSACDQVGTIMSQSLLIFIMFNH